MVIDESLNRFLRSEYGEKLMLLAKLHGRENFKFGKKNYKISDLLLKIAALKTH